MKKTLLFLLTLSLVLFFNACSENDNGPSEPTDGNSAENYYPGEVGTTLTYEGESKDTNNVTTAYQRQATFSGTETVEGTEYTQQTNIVTIGPSSSTGDFLFRRSSTGVYIYVDPAIFSELLDSSGIDPGLVTINADSEIRLVAYPFSDTPSWDAYKVSLSALGGIVNLDLLNLTAAYQGQEQVTIAGTAMTAEKVEFTATIKIPESIQDIANPQTITVSAFAWFAKDVGLIKIQGSELILGAFGSGELNFTDTGGTVTEVLTSYNIQ